MRKRIWVNLMAVFLVSNIASLAFADELSTLPIQVSVPCLPSLETFNAPPPPDILENVVANMPDVESWEGQQKSRALTPAPKKAPHDSELAWPVLGNISSGYGLRGGGNYIHQGIDIPVPSGTPVQAAADGVVAEARAYSGYGNTVIIDHKNGTKTLYAHCSQLAVKKDEPVTAGQVIAFAGSTGRATTSHVHFGVMVNGVFDNPVTYLKEKPRQFVKTP